MKFTQEYYDELQEHYNNILNNNFEMEHVKPGFVKSLTYTVNEQGDWDARSAKARVIDVAISYHILSRKSPSRLDSFYEGVPA